MTLLVGVDVGTTNVKAVVYEPTGEAVAGASVATLTHHPRAGAAHYVASELWAQVVTALRQALGKLEAKQVAQIRGIAVTSMGESGVPLDADGEPTFDVIAWFDTRSAPQAEALGERFGRQALFSSSGLSLQPIWSLCKLLWLGEHQPEAFARTVRWLNVADYIAFRLSGVHATDYSLASRTHALVLRERRWNEALLADLNLPTNLFAPLVESGHRLGQIVPEAARETGLPAGTVVAAGGHDHVCGALAARVTEPGAVLNSIGTAEALFVPLLEPVSDPTFGEQGYTQGAHVVQDRYYAFGGQYTSGAAIEWLREVLGTDVPYGDLIVEAAETPPGSLGACFLPYLRIAAPPHDNPNPGGAFVGLSTDAGRGVMVRAVFEGLAFASKASLDPLLAHAEIGQPESITAIGGVTKNELLMQIKASVYDCGITVAGVEEATTLGAAMLGGIGAGVYNDISAALATLDHLATEIDPDPNQARLYAQIFERVYQRIYPALIDLHAESRAIQAGLVGEPDGAG
ncbi:MAG: FGGY-family carbohydrate kinase [Thermomicrobiales bacterium]